MAWHTRSKTLRLAAPNLQEARSSLPRGRTTFALAIAVRFPGSLPASTAEAETKASTANIAKIGHLQQTNNVESTKSCRKEQQQERHPKKADITAEEH